MLGYSAYRSVTLSFTYDESSSFTIIAEGSGLRGTSNDHPLNTAAMTWAYRHLGNQEWCLRLASVLAHVVYLAAGLRFLRKLRAPATLLGFGLLNLNPFLLEFFGLARGYGMASAFSLLALCLLQESWQRFGTTQGRTLLFLSSALTPLAVFANYTWLNFQVAFTAVALVLIVADYRASKVRSRGHLDYAAACLVVNGASIFYFAIKMLDLRRKGDLYAGTEDGFVHGTLRSLAQYYLYEVNGVPAAADVLVYSVLGVVALIGVWLVVRSVRERRVHFSGILFGILILLSLAPIAEHILFKTMFPADRGALCYVPLFAVLMACVADELASSSFGIPVGTWAASVLLTGAMVVHFARTANVTHTLIWWYDANTRDAITEVEMLFREKGIDPPVTIGVFWPFERTLNYYRSVRNYTWLERVQPDPPQSKPYDFLYCPIGFDLGEARKRYSLVRQYPESNAELLAAPRDSK